MRKIPKCRDIIRLIAAGYSERKVAEITGSTWRTVKKFHKAFEENKITWPIDSHVDDQYIYYSLFPLKEYDTRKASPKIDSIYDEVMNGKTRRVLYYEYKEICEANNEEALQYRHFCQNIKDKSDENKAAVDSSIKPGKQAYVLWLKEPVKYTDFDGVAYKGKVFLGILPYSQYVFAGLYQKDTKEAWIDAHVKMFKFFGGAPQELVAEKSKSTCFRDELQLGYRELAEYYSSYIIINEDNKYTEEVEEIIDWFTQEIEKGIFTSYEEAVTCVKATLDCYLKECPNGKKNRVAMFYDGEQKSLLKHPDEQYVPVVRKDIKILFNSHIKYEGNYYSVPFQFTMLPDKKAQIEVSRKSVKIYYNERIIAEHPRIPKGKGVYRTNIKDMPSVEEVKLMEWNPDRFLSWADKIGPNTRRTIKKVLGSKDIVQRAYIHCRTILQFSDTYGEDELERACEEILANGRTITYINIENIIKRNLSADIK